MVEIIPNRSLTININGFNLSVKRQKTIKLDGQKNPLFKTCLEHNESRRMKIKRLQEK